MNQRRAYHFENRYQSIRGRFWVNGRFVWRKLGTYADFQLDAEHKPLPVAKRVRDKLTRQLAARRGIQR